MFGSMGQTNVKNLGNGGTMDGDVTITGDLTVSGGISLSLNEVLQGTSTIDINSTEALLVRKDGDGGDVFIVDTTNSKVSITDTLNLNPTISSGSKTSLAFQRSGANKWRFIQPHDDSYLKLYNDGASATQMYFASNNNVGIHTNSPSVDLHIKDTSGNAQILVDSDSGGAFVDIDAHTGNDAYVRLMEANTVKWNIYNSNSADNLLIASASDTAMVLTQSGSVGIGGTPSTELHVQSSDRTSLRLQGTVTSDGVVSDIQFFNASDSVGAINMNRVSNDDQADMTFHTQPNSGSVTERMRIDASGNVGIGTVSPDAWSYSNPVLTLSGGTTANNYVAFNLGAYSTSTTGIIGDINFTQFASDGTTGAERAIIRGLNDGATDSVALKFYTTATGGAVTERMVIKSGGDVSFTGWVEGNDNNALFSNSSTGLLLQAPTTTEKIFFRDHIGTAGMTYDASNKQLGIGTENPAQGQSTPISDIKLDVAGNQMLSNLSSTNSDESKLFFFRSDGAVGSQGAVPDGLKIGAIEWTALTSGDNNNSITSARIEVEAGSTWSSASNRNADITFSTVGANTLAERMRINSTGVGIGCDHPSVPLEVELSGDTGTYFEGGGSGNGASDARHLTITASTTTNAGDTHTINAESATGVLKFATTGSDRMRIDSSAVIIGTHNSNAHRLAIESRHATVPYGQLVAGSSDQNQAVGFQFTVRDSDGSERDKMWLTNTGLGIGTAPDSNTPLHIQDATYGRARIESTGSDSFAILYLKNDAIEYAVRTNGSDVFEVRDDTAGAVRLALDANSRISLSNNDNNTDNTVFGKSAFNASSDNDSDRNLAIGSSAMGTGTVSGAQNNTAIGHQALTDITSADRNTAVGASVAPNITTGDRNTAIGADALGLSTIGLRNVAIGNLAMYASPASVAVADCVAIGYYALGYATHTTGVNGTVAIGKESLLSLTSGERNTAVGFESLKSNTIGDKNTAVGYQALESFNADTDGHGHNTAVGHNTMQGNVTGTDNTAIGNSSAFTGTNNMTAGDDNTFIGSETAPSSATPTNQTVIGKGATGQADNSVTLGNGDVTAVYMAQDSGATVHCARVEVEGNISAGFVGQFENDGNDANRYGLNVVAGADDGSGTTYYLACKDGDGDSVGFIANTSGTFALTDVSDQRLKKNIVDTSIKGIEKINQLKVRDFDWKKSGEKTLGGFIAQEVKDVFPQAVNETNTTVDGEENIMGVSRDMLVPLLIKAVQELSAKVEELEKK